MSQTTYAPPPPDGDQPHHPVSFDEQPAPSYVVAIGASAGGLKALEQLFNGMPTDLGMAFVVIQHLSPDFKSLMDDLLARHTKMTINRVTHGMPLAANNIYLIPPNASMTVSGNRLHLSKRGSGHTPDLPIDTFFSSLAEDAGSQAIAIILSGSGSDGALGLQRIHHAGGLVIVQKPETAQFDGMPRAALNTDKWDLVLLPEEMPHSLRRFSTEPQKFRQDAQAARAIRTISPSDEVYAGEFADVFRELQRHCGINFGVYKDTTVNRRIRRRMGFLNIEEVPDYTRRLQDNPQELDQLYHDLLIGVTEFFRDPEAFHCLREQVITPLFERADVARGLRCWVAGCATGEEAYSLAILLHEAADQKQYTGRITIFATDVHKRSLDVASAGLYEISKLGNLTAERRDRYFKKEGEGHYRVRPELRQMIVFAPHDLLSAPPFTKVDLVSCRNMLIYLQPNAQEKILSLFHFSLNARGFLLLGPSEGLGGLVEEFSCLHNKWKLFRKERNRTLPMDVRLDGVRDVRHKLGSSSAAHHGHPGAVHLDQQLLRDYDRLLARHMPPGFLLDEAQELIHVFGDAGDYLKYPEGRVKPTLVNLLSGDLRLAVAASLRRAENKEGPIVSKGIRAIRQDSEVHLDLTIEKLPDPKTGTAHYHISLLQRPSSSTETPSNGIPVPSEREPLQETAEGFFQAGEEYRQRAADLEIELQSTKENLQATVEELQTSNEELQATNEEMLAANEELQSTNEELHSVNEELFTVNAEYERKNNELKKLNEDHDHLLRSIDTGVVFLDNQLCIRKFNPAIARIFKLLSQDIGRPIDHIAYHLDGQEEMLRDVRLVLEGKGQFEKDVRTREGRWLLKRVLPYRSGNESVEGVVLTFTDITKARETQEALRLNQERFKAAATSSLDAFFLLRIIRSENEKITDFEFTEINEAAERLLGRTRKELLGHNLLQVLPFVRRHPRLFETYFRVARSGEPVIDEFEINEESIEARWLRHQVIRVGDSIAITASNISTRKQTENELIAAKNNAESANRAKSEFLAVMSHELRTPLNPILGFCDLLRTTNLDERQAKFIDNISNAGENLLALIGDILDLTKIEAQRFRLERVDFHLGGFLAKLLNPYIAHAHHKGLKFTQDNAFNLPSFINSDPNALRKILINVVNNAIKFTERGVISLHTEFFPDADSQPPSGNLVFSLSDTGIGIPKDKLAEIFEPFVQADSSATRRYSGTGLGLAISRNLAQTLGGKLEVASKDGEGSTFTLTIPVVVATSANQRENLPTPDLNKEQGSGQRVLLVEDDRQNQEVAGAFLESLGFQYALAPNGLEAVEMLRAEKFSVVLMDIRLPFLNGYEATRIIRAEFPRSRQPYIIAMTANAMQEDRQKCLECGMDDYISKPVTRTRLADALDRAQTSHHPKLPNASR